MHYPVYPDWDMGISYAFSCTLGLTVLILTILRFIIFSYVGSKFLSASCSESPAVRVLPWWETNTD